MGKESISWKEKSVESEKSKNPESKYHLEAIAELEKPAINLVSKLKEAIDRGVYDAIIGDDASGRIPTLAMKRILSERLAKLHPDLTPEERRELLKTFFIAGGTSVNENYAVLQKFFSKIKPKIKSKALLVTEYISSGESSQQLGELLDKAGIPFDLAALRSHEFKRYYQKYRQLPSLRSGNELYIGDDGNPKWPEIYRSNLSGVIKVGNPNIVHTVPDLGVSKQVLSQSREDAAILADQILKAVWQK